MSGTRAISTASRRELSSFFFFPLQGKAPKEIHAILTETLACFLPGRTKDVTAPLFSMTDSMSCVLKFCSASAFTYTAWVGVVWVVLQWRHTILAQHWPPPLLVTFCQKVCPLSKMTSQTYDDPPPPQATGKWNAYGKWLPTFKAKTPSRTILLMHIIQHNVHGLGLLELWRQAAFCPFISPPSAAQNDTETPLFWVITQRIVIISYRKVVPKRRKRITTTSRREPAVTNCSTFILG